jgi:hypothetical protein
LPVPSSSHVYRSHRFKTIWNVTMKQC